MAKFRRFVSKFGNGTIVYKHELIGISEHGVKAVIIMDIKCPDKFLPASPKCNILPNYRILTEDIEQIAIVKAALRTCTAEQEGVLLSVQRRLQEGKKQIEICTQESNAIELELNAVETQIAQALRLSQEAESEALRTVKENGAIKRKIIALKSDVEEQGRIIKRARETMQVITDNCVLNNKKFKVLPGAAT